MKQLFLAVLVGLGLIPGTIRAQSNFTNPPGNTITYTNNGTAVSPQIDAATFVNLGFFEGNSLFPFESFDTLVFINQGLMFGATGFRFDFNSSRTGKRGMASSFVNFNPASVGAEDVSIITVPPPQSLNLIDCVVSPVSPSYVLISATNISAGGGISSVGVPVETTGASLFVGANGLMDLTGHKIDLSYSGLEVLPVWDEAIGTAVTGGLVITNFAPDLAIFDLYWVQDSFSIVYPLDSGNLWDGSTAISQGVPSPPCLPTATPAPSFLLPFPVADSYITPETVPVQITNVMGSNIVTQIVTVYTNEVKGAVFAVAPPEFGISEGFAGGDQPLNEARTIGVSFSTTIHNSVTGKEEPALLNIVDTLASDTRIRGYSGNLVGCPPNYPLNPERPSRPQNYMVDRGLLDIGTPNNRYPEPDFFISADDASLPGNGTNILSDAVTNAVVIAGDYAGYGAYADNIVSRPQAVIGSSPTNTPGRVHISGDNLDLTQTRIRGEGQIFIDTPHLISSSNVVIDCENLSYNLSSVSGNLKVQSLVPPGSVARFGGSILAWSAVWSNTVVVLINNYMVTNEVDTNTTPPTTNFIPIFSPLTNTYGVTYHTLMVDGSGLHTSVPVNVYDFATHNLNVEIDDDLPLVQSLLIDGRSLTVNGNITIPGAYPVNPITGLVPQSSPLDSWVATNSPNLLYFTNNGGIGIISQAHFGDDRPPYLDFVNNGQILASSIAIDSGYFENNGTLSANNLIVGQSGALFVRADTAKLQNGSSTSGGLSQFTCGNLKFNNYRLTVGGDLVLWVTNSLSDTGAGSGNVFQLSDGFSLLMKPQLGDLLGTTIRSVTPLITPIRINHVWAAEDRGTSTSGFKDNAAVGSLVLSSGTNVNALFTFSGTGIKNAIYVDQLDLSGLPDYTNQILINPNLTIYYAKALLAFTPPPTNNTTPVEPEEFLDGQFGGRLRWVPSFAGPNSSTPVDVTNSSGQTVVISVNSALANSQILDSNGDGIPNGAAHGPPNFPSAFAVANVDVQVSGNGTVTPNYGGQPLIVGQSYGLIAEPADGFTFSGWTGDVTTNTPVLNFVLPAGGFSVTANFSFSVPAGSYSGLFFETDTNGIEFLKSGSFTLKTTRNARFSGALRLGNQRLPFSGQLDDSGAGSAALANGLALQFQVASNTVSGSVGDGATWSADLEGDRQVFNASTRRAPVAGRYTISFPGSGIPNDSVEPQGNGYGSVVVDASGRVRLSASLADGTRITQTAAVTEDLHWPLYAPFPRGQGQILGWLSFVKMADRDISGTFNWIRMSRPSAQRFTDGFTLQTNVLGSLYVPTANPLTGFSFGQLMLTGGNLDRDILEFIDVQGAKVKPEDSSTHVTLNRSQGFFSGRSVNPDTGKAFKFSGALLQLQMSGAGYFLGTNQSGAATMSAQ